MSVGTAQERDGSKLDGDYHIYHPSTGEQTPEALCGYQPEVDEETNAVVPVEPTGNNCADCLAAANVDNGPSDE